MNTGVFNLIQAHVFIRHGARSPIHYIKTDLCPEPIWSPELFKIANSPIPISVVDLQTEEKLNVDDIINATPKLQLPGDTSAGLLTTLGYADMVEIGKKLRNKYINELKLFSAPIKPTDIFCRSTRIARTVLSLQAMLIGMFDQSSLLPKNADGIKIYCDTLANEILFPNPFCISSASFYPDGFKEHMASPVHINMKSRLEKVLKMPSVKDVFYPDFAGSLPVYYIRDDFIARQYQGFPLPPGIAELLPEMSKLAAHELNCEQLGQKCNWSNNSNLVVGQLFNLIKASMLNISSSPKLYLYSTHDSTLLAMLVALNCFDGEWPPFGAEIVFELYHESRHSDIAAVNGITHDAMDRYWVKAVYLGKVLPLAQSLDLEKVVGTGAKLNEDLSGLVPLSALINYWSKTLLTFEQYIEWCTKPSVITKKKATGAKGPAAI